MAKSRDAFRTISEVSDLLETPAHVLRFWESRFSQIKPVKRAGGRRYYRPADLNLLAGIKQLLHDDGITIKGVQKILREKGVKHVSGLADVTLTDTSATDKNRAKTTADTSAIDREKPVRWIDPLPETAQESPSSSTTSADENLTQTQSTPERTDEAPPRRFGFVPNSIVEDATKPEHAEEPMTETADSMIRREANKANGAHEDTDAAVAAEINDATSEERIVALYNRLKSLRTRVQNAIAED